MGCFEASGSENTLLRAARNDVISFPTLSVGDFSQVTQQNGDLISPTPTPATLIRPIARCLLLSKQKLLFSQPGRIKQAPTEVVTLGEERQTFRRKRARGDHHNPTHEEHILTAEGTDLPLASTTCSPPPPVKLLAPVRIHARLSRALRACCPDCES